MKTYIYALICPKTKDVKYIGKSTDPKKRLYCHIQAADTNLHYLHSTRWIRSLLAQGLRPELKIIFEVPANEDWAFHERRIIQEHIDLGCKLTNGTKGGEGVRFLTPEQEQDAKEKRAKGYTKEVRKRMSESMKKAWATTEKKERHKKAMSDFASRPEIREQLMKNTARTPEREAKRLQGVKKYWENPENRKKLSDKMKQKTRDPSYLKKLHDGKKRKKDQTKNTV